MTEANRTTPARVPGPSRRKGRHLDQIPTPQDTWCRRKTLRRRPGRSILHPCLSVPAQQLHSSTLAPATLESGPGAELKNPFKKAGSWCIPALGTGLEKQVQEVTGPFGPSGPSRTRSRGLGKTVHPGIAPPRERLGPCAYGQFQCIRISGSVKSESRGNRGRVTRRKDNILMSGGVGPGRSNTKNPFVISR